MLLNEFEVTPIPQLLGIRRLTPNETNTRNSPTFLVNCDKGLDITEITKVIYQLPQLLRRFDVAPKQYKTTRLKLFKTGSGFGVEFRSRNPRQ